MDKPYIECIESKYGGEMDRDQNFLLIMKIMADQKSILLKTDPRWYVSGCIDTRVGGN